MVGYNCPGLVSFCWITSQMHSLKLAKKLKSLTGISALTETHNDYK